MSTSQLLVRPSSVFSRRKLVALFFAAALSFALLNAAGRAEASATAGPSGGRGLMAAAWGLLPVADAAPAPDIVITWRAQDNPHVINGTYVIPLGTRLVMEPGVVVQFNDNSKIQVDGELVGQGTAQGRIQLQRSGNYAGSIMVYGTLNLAYTDIAVTLSPASGDASLLLADCVFKKYGYIWTYLGYMYESLSYIQLDRCAFESASKELPIYTFLTVDHATLVMRGVSFTGGAYAKVLYSYVYVDGVTSDGALGSALGFNLDGPVYMDNVTVTNASEYGLQLGSGYRPGNYFLGPNVKLQGNSYPVSLEGAGLLPGSTLPTTGNATNAIRAAGGGPGAVWGKLAIPYHLYGVPGVSIAGTTIAPGVTVKVAPQTTINAGGNGIRGTFDQPITFERLSPAQDWFAIGFQDQGSIMEHVVVDGSQGGVETASNSHSYVYLNDAILRNNLVASGGGVYTTGTQFINNGTGYTTTGGLTAIRGYLDGSPASPNSFVGNGKAVSNSSRDVIMARYNWWNSPTGPTAGNNPGGTGEVAAGVDPFPFLTAAPDYAADRPPVVRLHKPFHTYAPGSKVTLSWDSTDDKGIVAHRVLFSEAGAGNYDLLAELPGDQRAYEWTVPEIGFQVTGTNAYVRVVAVDSAGHERFDDAEIVIPSPDMTGSITPTTDVAGKTFKTGDSIPFEYTVSDSLRYAVKYEYLLIAGEGLVGARTLHSTDNAQVAVVFHDNGNRELWFYSPVFKLRPDSRLSDQPPAVAVTSPASGTAFAAGDVIPVTWTASDDEGLRSFNVQVSYDGGTSWTTVARDLPASTTSYNVRTAPGTGHADIRVRVTAYDRRFQSSNAGADRVFSTSGAAQNLRPLVTLTSPGTQSQFNLGSPVTLTAEASDRDGAVARVDFYAGSTLVGTIAAAPYRIVWNNAPAGTHVLTAVATDDRGGTTRSVAVNLIINAEPPAAGSTAGAAWAAGYNGPSNRTDGASRMAVDAQGNVYLTGDSMGSGTEIDMATVKYDPQGRQLWAARYVGPGNDFACDVGVDAQGNVYVLGQTWREYNFDGGTEQDIVLLKYSTDGELLWTRYYTGTQAKSSQDSPFDMVVDAQGNVYIAGMTYRATSDRGILMGMSVVLKYDTGGNQVWASTYDTPGEHGSMAKHIFLGPSGDIYVAGTVDGAVVATDTTDSDIFVARYDAAGNLLWRSLYDTPGNPSDSDDVGDVKADAQGNVYLCGVNSTDLLTFKYSPGGALAWVRKLDVSYLEGVSELALDGQGNVYVVGSAEFRHNSGLPNDDAVTFKYDNNGNHQWTRTYTGMWNGSYVDDAAVGVLIDSAGNALVGMETRDEAGKYVFGLLKYTPDGAETVRIFRGPNGVGTDTLNDMAFDGAGDLYLAGASAVEGQSANFLVMKIAQGEGLITPDITWSNPADITYGTPLGATQLNATTNVPGTFTYTPAAGTVLSTGYNPLSVKFTPADTARYRSVTKGVTLLVQKAPIAITLGNLNQAYTGTPRYVSVVTNPPDINYTVTYSQNGTVVATSYNGNSGSAPVNRGSYDVKVTINSIVYEGTATGVLVIGDKPAPAVSWNNPADITYGTLLGAAQLNATASVPGTFQYSPAVGTRLNAGGQQQLTVTFTPTDAANYSAVSRTVFINVLKAAPTVTWNDPAAITYGTLLGAAQLNATASVPGTFAYSPATGAKLDVGTHQLTATFTPADAANYETATRSVQIRVGPPVQSVQFSQAGYTTDEAAGFVTLTVTRTGDTSQPASVKYQTSDLTDVNFRCDPSTAGQVMGAASRKCDYHLAAGRLRFAAGESSRTIVLSVVNDAYVEGPENFTVSLSDATGLPLGQNATATVTITDDGFAGMPNPIDDTRYYVRQLYVDLLSREPDQSGWDGWTSRIELCGQPGQAPPPCDRVTVGGDGFLRSGEFFDRQFFVLRLYRTAFGRILQYGEVGDLAFVSGFLSPADLELNKQELVAGLMSRQEFKSKYDGLGDAGFVDTLLQTANITVPRADRDAWVLALGANTRTQAQVLREISERQEVSSKYLTEAQVVSAYYGFFTRNPDGAYLNYLERLNKGEINLGDLANAFINAAEYRQRFGP